MSNENEPDETPEPEQEESGGIDLPDLPVAAPKKPSEIEDTFKSAIKMAFVGAGQGGGRIAETFYKLGYRKVCAINTTNQDLDALTLKSKLVVGRDKGGAGKDPSSGEAAAKTSFDDIVDLLKRGWGDDVEQTFVCVGGGGGSGTGSWPVIIDAIREYAKITGVEAPRQKHIGVILTLPKRSEGHRVQKNALGALTKALAMVEAKEIETLIVVDNARIEGMFPKQPAATFWDVANQSFAMVLHTFNLLAEKNSQYVTFDKADFKGTLRAGLTIFGMTSVESWEGEADISEAVRKNLKGSLLGEGFDFSQASVAAACVVAHKDVLESIPMSNIDDAFHALTRALGPEQLSLTHGIYEGKQPGMRVFTMVGGLNPPADRLAELTKLGK